jgi:hypothetical protein
VPFGLEIFNESRTRGIALLVVSDNYMPASQLVEMAHRAGFTSLAQSEVMVSCEHGGLKHNGRLWREGVSFPAWTPDEATPHVSSIEAHVGRLLAYATKPGERWGPQVALVDRALSVRELPLRYHGCAPTLRGLGGTWAVPGTTYPERIAAIAEAIRVC